jgi:branched-chain amino acid transport system substrate-binding protein
MRAFSTFLLVAAGGLTITAADPAGAEVLIGVAAPLTGAMAWGGAETQQGAELAVADLNAKGGVLGERIEIVTADDYCSGDQAIAAATKLIAAGVVVVIGHECSGAAIPASRVYDKAAILFISPAATNPKLTEQGLRYVFRMAGRDDLQGRLAADLLTERFGNRRIAILHDGAPYGKGLAEETKLRLNERGITETMFEVIEPGKRDYWDTVQKMRTSGVEVLYYGGYPAEAALIVRQAKESGYSLQLVGGDGLGPEDFALIAGPAANGTLLTDHARPVSREAAEFAERFETPSRAPFRTYSAVQVWAQAVEKVGSFETKSVAEAFRTHEFDTMLGRIGFDGKGDVSGFAPFVWYEWKGGKVGLLAGEAD